MENDSNREIERLRQRVSALEQLLSVHEQTVLEQASRFESAMQRIRDQSEALRAIVAGTALAIGKDFFHSLVSHLASVLKVRYAVVGELKDTEGERIRTLAVWADKGFAENCEYDLRGTPCEQVIHRKAICHYPQGVQQLFPDDRVLAEMEVESYWGAPLLDREGCPLGLLTVMHDGPLPFAETIEQLLAVFAARAGAELKRKRAEDALRDSEARYRLLFDSNPHPMWVYDRETLSFLAVNEAAVAHYGYSKDEFLAMTIKDIRPAEDVPALLEHLARGTTEFKPSGNWRHRKKDGTIIEVEISGHALNFGGRPAKLILAHDITDRRRAEEALRETGERLLKQESALLELIQGEIFAPDLDVALRQITEAVARTLGVERVGIWRYTEDRSCIRCVDLYELSKRRHSAGTELREAAFPAYFHALATSKIIVTEDACQDSRTREFSEAYLSPLGIRSMMDVPIRFWGRLEGVLRYEAVGLRRQWMQDEQIFAMAMANLIALAYEQWERRRAEQALQESESALRSFFNSSPLMMGMVKIVDHDVLHLSGNAAAARLLGVSVEAMRNRRASELGIPDAVVRNWIDRYRESERRGGPVQFEYDFETPEGLRWLSATACPITTLPQGRSLFAYVVEDVTERKHLEGQLRQAQKMEAVGRLAGGIAHDFNNLLTVILGYSQLLLSKLSQHDDTRKQIEGIKQAGERAAALTNQLLTFSRRQMIQPRVLSLNEVVHGAVNMLTRLIGEDIQLTTSLQRDLRPVKADRGQLDQVLLNLAVNARDAMPQGGKLIIETANVERESRSPSFGSGGNPTRWVRLTVRDTGLGMDQKTLVHLFEPFFTTKEFGKGTGLGLATVYGIVTQNGGTIAVDSAPGCGTSFIIDLPAVDAEEWEIEAQAPPLTISRGTETILLVEDEGMVREYVRKVLAEHGYHILESATGDEALRHCQEYPGTIHLLLTDTIMPGLNGRQLAEQIAAQRPSIKVLFMSGYPNEVLAFDSVLGQVPAFLQKPVSPDALLQKVRESLDSPFESAT